MTPQFDTWKHENLVQFAKDSYEELIALRQDLKTAIGAYRALIRNTKDVQDLQQLPTEQVQPDWAESTAGGWYQIPMDLSDV
jgi:hypothetical protein